MARGAGCCCGAGSGEEERRARTTAAAVKPWPRLGERRGRWRARWRRESWFIFLCSCLRLAGASARVVSGLWKPEARKTGRGACGVRLLGLGGSSS